MGPILSTEFILAQTVISNGLITGNGWTNPNNLLLTDTDVANSNVNETASDVIIGNFPFALPENAVITGIEIELIGAYSGASTTPPITLTPYFVDNTSGENVYIPYSPIFTGFTPSPANYTLGSSNYLFATSFTPDQINNAKIALVANGNISIDAVKMKVFYYLQETPGPTPTPGDGCVDCDSPIQVQNLSLALPFKSDDRYAYLTSFSYADGTPVNYADLGSCGGSIKFTIDPELSKNDPAGNGNFAENTMTAIWTLQPSGFVQLDFGTDLTLTRGLQFHTPYTGLAELRSNHDVGARVVISDNGPFLGQLLRQCQIGSVVSKPIEVLENGVQVLKPTVKFNFTGGGQTVVADGTDPEQVNINIPGFTTVPPGVVSVTSYTSFNVLVSSGSADLDVSGLNRGAVVQVSTQEDVTIVSVTVGGVSCTQAETSTDAPNNLRQESWYCVNPPLGTQAVVVTLSGPAYLTFGAEALSEVDTSNMLGNTSTDSGNDNNPTTLLTTANTNSIVIDGLVTAQLPILYTPGPGQSSNWNRTAPTTIRQGASSIENAGIAPDAITMDYSITQSTPWCITAIEINGIPAVTPIVSPLTVKDESATTIPNVATIQVPDQHLTNPGGNQANINFNKVEVQITQTAHGFSLDQIVRSSGVDGAYTLAQADVIANSDSVGIVTEVIDVDTFVITTEGHVFIQATPGVTGDKLYLDDMSAGSLTITPPVAPTSIIKQLGTVIDAGTNFIYFHNYLGLTQAQSSGGGGGASGDHLVGTGPTTNFAYFDTQLLFVNDGSTGAPSTRPWTHGSNTLNGTYADINGASDAIYLTTPLMKGFNYNANKIAICQFMARYSNATPAAGSNMGFSTAGTIPGASGANQPSAFFAYDASNFYGAGIGFIAVTYDAAGVSSAAAISGVTLTNRNVFRIEIDLANATPQVRFYVNGTLKATITTNLPGGAIAVGWGEVTISVNHDLEYISCPSFSIEL